MQKQNQTRREFLKASAALSAAAVGQALISRTAHAAGSDIIRVGMIGCGGRCSGAALDAMAADRGVRLVAMCDLFSERIQAKLKSLREQCPDQVVVDDGHCFVGLEGYKHVIDSSDVVLIANAAKFHPLHLGAAVEAGRHVFVEKPHAIDPVGVRQVAAACELAGQKKLSVLSGLHSRFDLAYGQTIQRVLDGAIGQIITIEENFLRAPYGTLYRDPRLNELHYQYSNQYRFSWLSGDDVTQSLIHNLDRATWAMGEQAPVKCHGLGGRSSNFDMPYVYGDVFDHHSVVYQYANGVRLYALCRTQVNCYNDSSSTIMGSKGIAYPTSGMITGQNSWKYDGPAESPYRREHQHLFKAIRSNEPLNCGHYMARSTMVAVMGELSCYSGQEITWDSAMKSEFYFKPRPQECTWEMEPPVKPDSNGMYPPAIPGKTKTV
jgi:predicted dehydrogenase